MGASMGAARQKCDKISENIDSIDVGLCPKILVFTFLAYYWTSRIHVELTLSFNSLSTR